MTNNLFKRTGADDFPSHMKIMVAGPPKSGKTTLLGTIPNLLVLDTEPHANNLASIAHLDVPYVTISNTDDLRQVAFMLGDERLRKQIAEQYGLPDIQGVAIDTLDTLQKLMKTERLKEQRKIEFQRDDWGWLKVEMEKIVELFTALPMHVVFTVHTKTKDMGKGDDSYTVVLPGLEGSIAESIAGMVGYSLLSFRKQEIGPDGKAYTKYWLQAEGDATHDFLGTRTAGRLPSVIEPHMGTIYKAIMAGRPQKKAEPVAQPQLPEIKKTGDTAEAPAQTPGQPAWEGEKEKPAEAPVAPAAERPAGEEPVNAAAMGHVKKVYDALEVAFPEEKIKALNMAEARGLVMMWRAVLEDHKNGTNAEGATPASEMLEYLTGQGLVSEQAAPAKKKLPEGDLNGTVEQVLIWVDMDLERIQEAYDKEFAKGDKARISLIESLTKKGAKTQKVETPVETSEPVAEEKSAEEPVTPEPAAADAPTAEEEAVKAVEEGLGGSVVSSGLREGSPCDQCSKPIDDLDLAELGQKRFDKVLCVEDYLSEIRKTKVSS